MCCSNRDTLPRDLSIMTLMKSRALIQISFHPTVSSKIKTENTLKFHGILFSLDLWPHCKLCWESTIEAKHIFKSELELYVLISLEFRLKLGSSPLRSYSHLKPVFFCCLAVSKNENLHLFAKCKWQSGLTALTLWLWEHDAVPLIGIFCSCNIQLAARPPWN